MLRHLESAKSRKEAPRSFVEKRVVAMLMEARDGRLLTRLSMYTCILEFQKLDTI